MVLLHYLLGYTNTMSHQTDSQNNGPNSLCQQLLYYNIKQLSILLGLFGF